MEHDDAIRSQRRLNLPEVIDNKSFVVTGVDDGQVDAAIIEILTVIKPKSVLIDLRDAILEPVATKHAAKGLSQQPPAFSGDEA